MITITLGNLNSRIHGLTDETAIRDISAACSYYIKGSEFSSYCQSGAWDGTKNLFNAKFQTFPTGLLSKVRSVLDQAKLEYSIIDDRIAPDLNPTKLNLNGNLRDYQNYARETALSCTRGIIKAPTASGKTVMIADVIANTRVKTLLLSFSVSVYTQLQKELEAMVGTKIGKIGDGEKDIQDITVAMVQSLVTSSKKAGLKGRDRRVVKPEYTEYLRNIQMLVIDECFVPDTLVKTTSGLMSIYSLYNKYINNESLPKVISFDEKSNIFIEKDIVRVFRNKLTKDLVDVKLSKLHLTCTSDHKFYTKRGWVEAKNLTCGDFVIASAGLTGQRSVMPNYLEHVNDIIVGSYFGDGGLQKVNNNVYRLKYTHCVAQKDYISWKAGMLNSTIRYVEKNGYAQKPAYTCTTKSFILNNSSFDYMLNMLNERSLAILYMDDGSFSSNCCKIHTNSYTYEDNIKLRDKIYSITGAMAEVKKNRHYYELHFNVDNTKKLHKCIVNYIHENLKYKISDEVKQSLFAWKKEEPKYSLGVVESVTLCKKITVKNVYDLEVADTHTYIVCNRTGDGVVVHNCHHVPCDTVQTIAEVCSNAYYRLGYTATPFRDDGLDILLETVCGRRIVDIGISDLIKGGYLSKPTINYINFKQPRMPSGLKYAQLYTDLVVNNDNRNNMIVKFAKEHMDAGQSVLISVQRRNHGEEIVKKLKQFNANVLYVHGDTDTEGMMQALDDLDKKKLMCVVATTVFKEGVNVRNLDVLILASATASTVATYQLVGRVLRKTETKDKVTVYDIADTGCRWLTAHTKIRHDIYLSEPEFF